MKTTLILILTTLSYLAYSQAPTSGLVAYYKFSGNANDSSGNSNHATVNNVTLTSDRFGNANKAYSFNGINSYISIPHHAMFNFSNYSISTWIKYNGPGPASTVFWSILSKNNTAGGNFDPFHILLINATKNSGGRIGSGTTHIEFSPSPSLNDGGWHQITIVFNNNFNTIRQYVDGVHVHTSSFTANPVTNTSPINIGRWAGYNNYFNGAIDDIRFYDRALSHNEIADLFQSENPSSNYISMYLKFYIEGYMVGTNSMRHVLYNQGIESIPSNHTDSAKINLIQIGPGSVIYTYKGIVNDDGMFEFKYPANIISGTKQVDIYQRNTLRTRGGGINLSAGLIYDFTTHPFIYQQSIAPNVKALYSGDLSGDLNIDLLDASIMELDIITFAYGFQDSDINGDGNVDLLDYNILENNINNFVGNPL